MSDLLPCPFCGSTDIAVTSCGPNNYYARCCICTATTDDGSREAAIAAWNRRAPDPMAPRIAELERRLGDLERRTQLVGGLPW